MQLTMFLADILTGILGPLDKSLPLMEAGLDSLGVVELRTAAESAFNISLPATLAFDYPNLDSMASFISSKIPQESLIQVCTSFVTHVKSFIVFVSRPLSE